MRFREASASARVSNCGLSPAAVVVDAVDVLASHEQGADVVIVVGVDVSGVGVAGSTGVAAVASAAATAGDGGGGGETSSVVSIELSSLSSDTLRTRVIG